jgi:hypothetical protein
MNRHSLITAALVLMATSQSVGAQTAAYRPEVGQSHPEIVLPSIDSRQPVSLSQFRGKKVLLIHFASW